MEQLTPRELEVVGLMVEGLSYKLLAARLGITVHGLKHHLTNIYQKMDCCNQVQVVVKALRMGLISLDNNNTQKAA